MHKSSLKSTVRIWFMKKSYIKVIQRLDKFASSFSSISTFNELALAVEKILEETYGIEYTGIYLYDTIIRVCL